jgi:predicted  nucleic acid-binding Zn-ribbon protein
LALKDVLELNDSQIAQVQQESAFFEQRISPLREQFGQLEEKSRAAENAGDANALGQAILERAPIQKQMEAERAAHRDRVLALLTADQKTKVNQMIDTLQSANGAYSVLNALGLIGEGGGMISHTSERGRGTIRHQK